jgi:hypothetical protein
MQKARIKNSAIDKENSKWLDFRTVLFLKW